MTNEPDKTVVDVWVCLNRAHAAVLSAIETALKQAGHPPLAWYDVLLELGRVYPKGLRPFELEQKLLLPQYGLSRLLDRIAASGYLERRPCEEDRRGQVLVITKAGRDLRRRMWGPYAAALDDAVATRLSGTEAAKLGAMLDRLTHRNGSD